MGLHEARLKYHISLKAGMSRRGFWLLYKFTEEWYNNLLGKPKTKRRDDMAKSYQASDIQILEARACISAPPVRADCII